MVAAVIYAFDPNASLALGALENTPDGTRTVDIELRSIHDGTTRLTAIDVINLPSGRKVDMSAIDAADSKRFDVKADAMLLCSNTGFEADAISKAKRKKIGLIAVLRQGDKRINATIEEQIYLRKITLVEPTTVTFERDKPFPDLDYTDDSLQYEGGSVIAWLRLKAAQIIIFNPMLERKVTAQFNLKKSTPFDVGNQKVMIHRWSITFHPHAQWLTQIVQLDAKAGIYDYVRGRMRLTTGSNSYTISGIDFDKATPLANPPEINDLGVGLLPGEIDTASIAIQGWTIAKGIKLANMDSLIVPQDLNPKTPKLIMQSSQ